MEKPEKMMRRRMYLMLKRLMREIRLLLEWKKKLLIMRLMRSNLKKKLRREQQLMRFKKWKK